MVTCYGLNGNMGHNNNTMNTNPYKEAHKEALYFKDTNIKFINRNHYYDPMKPTLWLQLLGLFETLEIIHNK
ncbi:hypothetical protein LCGC14_1494120 [marine sediment metagenome]|uniref:Uncharacterized protein n=1 Tax=marine sediment metagenome TaxID=412755 RepID=A0A0F9LLD0_9ZZZZ